MLHNQLHVWKSIMSLNRFVRKLRRYVPLNNFKPKFLPFLVAADMAFSSIFCISSNRGSWGEGKWSSRGVILCIWRAAWGHCLLSTAFFQVDLHQQAQQKLPAIQPELPTRPWEKLGTDIFEFSGSKYLMIVDYYSRFPIIRPLSNMWASTISHHFTSVLTHELSSWPILEVSSLAKSSRMNANRITSL